jgi:hypothetical protein
MEMGIGSDGDAWVGELEILLSWYVWRKYV